MHLQPLTTTITTMQDPFPIPSCFTPTDKFPDDPAASASPPKSGHSVVTSSYRTKIAGLSRLVTVTWCRNLLAHGLCVSLVNNSPDVDANVTCKVELKPWCFWRKHGSKRLHVDGAMATSPVHVFWDLRTAKFCGEPEPRSGFHVAVVCDGEIVLLLGDLVHDAYRRTRCQPSGIDAVLVSKKEHVFGKKRFATRMKLGRRTKQHEIVIECGSNSASSVDNTDSSRVDPQMVVRIDGKVMISVKHLQWKFRGNETISLNRTRVEVFWDVHDWLFSPGMRNGLFIFRPLPAVHSSLLTTSCSPSSTSLALADSNSFSLFLYAWKIE